MRRVSTNFSYYPWARLADYEAHVVYSIHVRLALPSQLANTHPQLISFSGHCTVAEACHGQEALDLMTSGLVKPDIVGKWTQDVSPIRALTVSLVTDRTMPILDGDELLQVMRSKLELRWIPIIMVTADAVRPLSGCRHIAHLNPYQE